MDLINNFKNTNEFLKNKKRPNFIKWPIVLDEEKSALISVLESHRWGGIFSESETMKFEKEFCEFNGSKFSIAMCNGTLALYASLKALDINKGDEVLVPSFSYVASATAISLCGATPVFVDIDKETLQIDFNSLSRKITIKTKAIIVVHLWGNCCRVDKIKEIAKNKKLFLIEDCCQAIGAKLNGIRIGNFGDIGIFSFSATKTLSAGEGGLCVTNDKNIYSNLSRMRNHGRIQENSYYHEFLGWNFRINEFSSSILRCQLKGLDELINKKNKSLDYFMSLLDKNTALHIMKYEMNSVASPFGIPLIYDKNQIHEEIFEVVVKLLKEFNIKAGERKIIPLFENPVFKKGSLDYQINIHEDLKTVKNVGVLCLGQPAGEEILLSSDIDINLLAKFINCINSDLSCMMK